MTKIFSYDQTFKIVRDMLNDAGLGSKHNVYAKFPEPLMDCIVTFVIVFCLAHLAPLFYMAALGVAMTAYTISRSFGDWLIVIFEKDIDELNDLDSLNRKFPFRLIGVVSIMFATISAPKTTYGNFDGVWVATGIMMACSILMTVLNDPTDSYIADIGREWYVRMFATIVFIACGISMGPILKDYMIAIPSGDAGMRDIAKAIIPTAFFGLISLLCLGSTETKNKLLNKIARFKYIEERKAANEVAAKKILDDIRKVSRI